MSNHDNPGDSGFGRSANEGEWRRILDSPAFGTSTSDTGADNPGDSGFGRSANEDEFSGSQAFGTSTSDTGAGQSTSEEDEREENEFLAELQKFDEKQQKIHVGNRYEKVKFLGRGGFGSVNEFRRRNYVGKFHVAGKEILLNLSARTEDILREAKTLSKLQHDNVVKYYCAFVDTFDKTAYLFMELHPTSVSKIASENRIAERDAALLTRNIMDGLIYIHGKGTIHCDIKGGNILLDHRGTAKLADFGLSKVWKNASMESSQARFRSGTKAYKSPELLHGDRKHGRRTDVWAVGCTVIEMVKGKPLSLDEGDVKALKHREFVQKQYANELQGFLLNIFVEIGKRWLPKDLREHAWLKNEDTTVSSELLGRINGTEQQQNSAT